MALYHTYRPQTFDAVLGQPHIVGVLKSALAHDRVSHAYLFSGPRGVGKTSIARILAKAINCQENAKRKTPASPAGRQNVKPNEAPKASLPCNTCQACTSVTDGSALDVIEIDAASNRGIDEIRELRDRVRFAPTSLAKKVYIIDEVHMLTKEAFNALLKTLEEPPDHAVFVLATTELGKIPETIFSRCQHFNFRRATPEALMKQLQAIATAEGRTVTAEALELMVLRAEGSYRDALSALEQLLVAVEGEAMTAAHVRELFGMPAEQLGLDVVAAVAVSDRSGLLETLQQLMADGVSLESFASELVRLVRLLLLLKSLGATKMSGGSDTFRTAAPALLRSFSEGELLTFLERLVQVTAEMRTAPLPSLPLELALLSEVERRAPSQASSIEHQASSAREPIPPDARRQTPDSSVATKPAASLTLPDIQPIEAVPAVAAPAAPVIETVSAQPALTVVSAQPSTAPAVELTDQADGPIDHQLWHDIRRAIWKQDTGVGMLVANLASPLRSGATVMLEVPFKFHADRLLSKKPRTLLTTIFTEQLGSPVEVRCAVNPMTRSPVTTRVSAGASVVENPVEALSEL